MPTVNEELFDRTVRHQVFVSKLSVGTANRMIALMNDLDADLIAAIIALDPTDVANRFQIQRLERLSARLKEINDATKSRLKEAQGEELTALATHEVAFQASLTQEVVGAAVTFDLPSPTQIRAAALSSPFQGTHLRWVSQGAHVDETFRRRLKQVDQEIKKAFIEGDSIGQIVTRIRGTRANQFKDGILELSRRDAHTIARTAVNHVANRASELFAIENEEFIKARKWTSVIDGRTSQICQARSGKIAPVGGVGTVPGVAAKDLLKPPNARPPAHPNCRSIMTNIMKSFRDLGIDADDAPGLLGDNPDDISYGEWLRKQPRSVVVEIEGPTRAKLFLDGDLELDRFVDRKGSTLTIDQLRVREMAAFEKAGLTDAA